MAVNNVHCYWKTIFIQLMGCKVERQRQESMIESRQRWIRVIE